MYSLFEDHIILLSPSDLRPVLKSLILSLLPALEEETSEDFDRAFQILENLETKFSPNEDETHSTSDRDGFFWQCLFLAVITSPSRRQGALNFLVRKLPKLCADKKASDNSTAARANGVPRLSSEADTVTSPEPGLLIRCFACGLSDSQLLIQRGFLDLIVTHLPLDSPLLQSRVQNDDLDRLVSAAVQVLLRREMSLNRRLWSWFLGPDPQTTASDSQPSSPDVERKHSSAINENGQFKYFSAYGRRPLERCMLLMFQRETSNPSLTARPFRICLSLMDRWEIGGSIVPSIFLPAIESAFRYSLSALSEDTSEVLRSASLFFDGVEATLIWENLLKLLKANFAQGEDPNNDQLFAWIVQRFNINDEEMLTVHIPYATAYLLSLLQDSSFSNMPFTKKDTALNTVAILLEKIPERAFSLRSKEVLKTNDLSGRSIDTQDLRNSVENFYSGRERATDNGRLVGNRAIAELLGQLLCSLIARSLDQESNGSFAKSTALMLDLYSKTSSSIAPGKADLLSGISRELSAANDEGRRLSFPTITSIISLMTPVNSTHEAILTRDDILKLEPAITCQIWYYLSPSFPKYNVDAVKLLWQLQELLQPEASVEASLTGIIREGLERSSTFRYNREETCRRFAMLWNHTVSVSSNPKAGLPGSVRRGSTMPSVSDSKQASHRQQILTDSLMLILDMLSTSTDIVVDTVRSWLHGLVSIDRVFTIHFDLMFKHVKLRKNATNQQCNFPVRQGSQSARELTHITDHFLNILRGANDWVWDSLNGLQLPLMEDIGLSSGAELLTESCIRFLREIDSPEALKVKSLDLLAVLLDSPLAFRLRPLEVDSRLIDHLMSSLSANKTELQGPLLRLISRSLRLRLASEPYDTRVNGHSTELGDLKRTATTESWQSPNASSANLATSPPAQLLICLRMGFSSVAARDQLHQWLAFLSGILPIYADAIFASIIPLVECLCAELQKAHDDLLSASKVGHTGTSIAPEATAMILLEALEMVLSRAHECLVEDNINVGSKGPSQSRTLLSNVTPGAFKSEGPPSKTTQANSRLTVILTFQDAIRVSLRLWIWASHSTETDGFDKASAATTTYNALKVRNRTRYLLEQMFTVEPLESLEVLLFNWCKNSDPGHAAATLDLLQVMQGLRPKNVIPTILDSLCSRTNVSMLPAPRQSSQAIELTALDVALFLLAYLKSTEDDAMDEVWADCMAFLRDVLSNPLPFRQVLPALLSLILLLAQKADNTNFGEQRKMRRDLGDIFQRLLVATFTTLPTGYTPEINATHIRSTNENESSSAKGRRSMSLLVVLKDVLSNAETILETSDRTASAVNSVSTNIIAPLIHAKSFPGNIGPEALELLLQLLKRAPVAKSWRKELLDAFNDPRLLTTSVEQMEIYWFPVIYQWCLHDKERMPELLSRLSPPSSAGIMFGVGANAARLEADRRTQLNLRRICILLLSSPEDTFTMHSRLVEEKLVELFDANPSSSPSAAIKAELFMVCRALVLSTSAIHLAPVWPIINDNLQSALMSLMPNAPDGKSFSNISLLQACKLLDLLITLSPDEFQLHEWLYITDTIDAVYQPLGRSSTSISDQVTEALTSDGTEDGNGMIPPTPIANNASGRRRPLIDNQSIADKEDLKAATRDDFARAIIRPFLSQLSIHAYEGVYSMDKADISSCRRILLEDLLDLSTIVE